MRNHVPKCIFQIHLPPTKGLFLLLKSKKAPYTSNTGVGFKMARSHRLT